MVIVVKPDVAGLTKKNWEIRRGPSIQNAGFENLL